MLMNSILHFLFGSAGLMMSPIWRDRGKWFIPTVVVASVVVAGAALSPIIPIPGGGGEPGIGTANLWLAPSASNNCTGGRSSTPIDYSTAVSQNRVCTTLNAAYVAANTGDTVLIRSGSYGNQTVAAAGAKIGSGLECDSLAPGSDMTIGKYPVRVTDYSDCIYFRPETGASVTFGYIILNAPYIYIDGGTIPTINVGEIDFGSDNTCATSHDQVVSGVYSNTAMFMRGSHSTLQYSNYNVGDEFGRGTVSQFNGTCEAGQSTHSNVLYRNTFQNLLQFQRENQDGQNSHMECIHLNLGANNVIDSNKFFNCAQYGLSVQAAGPITNIKVVQNVWDVPCSHQPVRLELTGNFTSGSNVITGISNTSGVNIGDPVYSLWLPYVNNVLNPPTVPVVQSKTANSLTLSGGTATANRSSQIFTVRGGCGNLTAFKLISGAVLSDPLVAFNSFYKDVDGYDTGIRPITGAVSYGNISLGRGSFFCESFVSWAYIVNDNSWSNSDPNAYNCGGSTGSVVGPASYVDPANYDFRITSNSAANNLVPNNYYRGVPSVDVNGNPRTGNMLDAGAYDSTAAAP